MHVQFAGSTSLERPHVGQIVNGFVRRTGSRGQIVRVAIENTHSQARTVPRTNDYADGTPVECKVESREPHLLNLRIIREVDLSDY